MKKYDVFIQDSVSYYCIEAETPLEAQILAEEWWHDRYPTCVVRESPSCENCENHYDPNQIHVCNVCEEHEFFDAVREG